ncbi:hypothetical protein F1880_008572 [Penicillium rolfsii]|nr:hypothetical protein F1880_008572 [Penicillium rolfsii]
MSVSKTSGEYLTVADRVESQGRAQQKANDRGPRQRWKGRAFALQGRSTRMDGLEGMFPVVGMGELRTP